MLWTVAVLLAAAPTTEAASFPAGSMHVDEPWARPMPAVSRNGAVYMTLRNAGPGSDSLVGASTPASERVELHAHVHQDGMMSMRPVDKVAVPAGGRAVLEPGGFHLMLIGLNIGMTAGDAFPLTLRFEHAGEVEVMVRIGRPAQ